MQKTNNIIIKAALAVFAAFLAAGCIFEKMSMPEDLQSVLIQVNVSSGDLQTKAYETSSEAATAAEEVINTIRIYAFHNGRLSGHYYSDSGVNGPIVMDLKLPETGTASVDFYVVANENAMTRTSGTASLSESTKEVDLASFAFTSYGAADGSLPMYATTTASINVDNISTAYNTADGHTEHNYITEGAGSEDIFTVALDLKRSVAKISLYVATPNGSSDGVTLTDVLMPAKGTRQYGYLLPQTQTVLESVPPTDVNIDFLSAASMDVTGSVSSASYNAVFEDAYFFEVPFGSDFWSTPNDANSVIFNLTYTGGSGTVYMPPVERNNHYKVYCTLPPGKGKIEVSYEVADWEGDHQWTLDFAYPTYQSPVLKTGDHGNTGGDAKMYYAQDSEGNPTEEGAFSVDFQMTAPTGQKWTPTFFGDNADYKIKVYDGTTEVTPPVTASDKWYTIKIIPLKSDKVGSFVQFGITYNPSWLDKPEFLLINSGTVWNTTGSNEDLIVVTQVEKNNI